jgi:hypothetical protein
MLCQHGSNEIDMFGLPEDEENVEETDTGDEPLRDSQPMQIGYQPTQIGYHPTQICIQPTEIGSQPTQIGSQPTEIGMISTYHTHQGTDKEAEIAHSRNLCRKNQPAQCLAANAENITHSRCFRRDDQTARCFAAAIRKSSHVPLAAPAPTIRSGVTSSHGKASAEALTAFPEDP